MLENVPKPTPLPVFGPGQIEVYQRSGLNVLGLPTSKFKSSSAPFGTKLGYKTTLGSVAVPDQPVFGHVFCEETRNWILHASTRPGGGAISPWRR